LNPAHTAFSTAVLSSFPTSTQHPSRSCQQRCN
jgi:hypothetical protein